MRAADASPWIVGEGVPGLFSVVIPTYNRVHVLGETLESIRAQTHRPIEIVVVDDGSDDDTAMLLDDWRGEFATEALKLRAETQDNRGASAARNLGAARSTGAFIQFLDSDDLLCEQKFTEAAEALLDPAVMFAAHDDVRFRGSPDCIVQYSVLSSRSRAPADHIRENCLHTLSAVFRRSSLNMIGPWDESLSIWQDTEFSLRVLLAGLHGAWIPSIGAMVRDSETSIMNAGVVQQWEGMLRTSERLESVAAEHDALDQNFRSAVGTRLATISRRLAEDGDWGSSGRVFEYAASRLRPMVRLKHRLHRVGMRVVGTRLLRRMGWM